MSKRLQDRVAIITGSSSGLGRAISLAYTAEGAHVVCSDLQPHPRQSPKTAAEVADYAYDTSSTPTHELIIKNGGRAIFVKCDVGVEQEVEALVIAAVKEYGKLDIMVNNAGWAPESSITTEIPLRCHDMPTEIFDKTLAINTRGVFLGCKYACKQMLKQRMGKSEAELEEDGGWIVNLASILGLVGFNSLPGYCASKGAVVQLTKNVALDYAPERIHCNAMCPGFTDTAIIGSYAAHPETMGLLNQLHPMKGIGKAEDVARAAVFLASKDAAWVTGIALPIDGGYSAR